MSKKFSLTLFLWLTAISFPVLAQQKADSTFTFRFVADDDMFYVPWNGNGAELERLLACVSEHRAAILDGMIPVKVDGYSDSKPTAAENLAIAKTRSNRVKTELILRGELTEACFTTRNHTSGGNIVTVLIVVPAGPSVAERQRLETEERAEARHLEAGKRAEEQRKAEEAQRAAEKTETEKTVQQTATQQNTFTDRPAGTEAAENYHFAIRANLLRWATLTPDLGLEWRINPSWGIAVNGSWTSWNWNDKDRRYALWEVAPEVRYYMGEKKAWYVGAMFKAGEFNYKLSETGKQGDLIGGGITGGYQLRLNKALNLDFNLGLGYLNADFEKYEVIDGVRVRRGNETKDWWGPINAGVTLVWKLF